MGIEARRRYVFTKQTIISTVKIHDMNMYLMHIVNHVTEFDYVRLILKLVFVGFSHGISRISLLFLCEWMETSR